jgi:hypothetical protein
MKHVAGFLTGVSFVLVLSAGAMADVGIGLKVGTLGPGAELTVGLNEVLNTRIGLNKFWYTYETTAENDNVAADDLSAKLDLHTLPLLLDWHPFKGGFRLSGGLILNSNKITLSTQPGDIIDFDDREFQVTSVDGVAEFESVAPYLGIGVGNAVSAEGNWHIVFDLGVMFQGEPQIELSAVAANPAEQAALNAAVEKERGDLQDDASPFKYYPVLATGISRKF